MTPSIDELIAAMAPAEDHLYQSREERKYIVSMAVAERLRSLLGERLRLEEFVAGRARTLVHSIYFDSPDWTLYRESLRADSSLKFRLRGYATHGAGHAIDPELFLECKLGIRDGATRKKKRKARFATPHHLAVLLFEGRGARHAASDLLSHAPEPRFWRRALAFLADAQLVPRLTIRYEREAYVSEDGRLRVTLDEGFRATRIQPNNASRLDDPHGTLPDQAILEIKFVGEFPAWLGESLRALELDPEGQAFSKFRTAVPLLFPEVRAIVPEATG